MFQNMSVLRSYAGRSILLEEELEDHEEIDRQNRLNWTPKEVTALLQREAFANPA